MSCGVKGTTLAAATRSRRITATPHPRAAVRRLVRRELLGQTTPRRPARAPPAVRGRLPLEQKVRDCSILLALSARTLMANVSARAYYLCRKRCWTGIEFRPI